MRKITKKSYLFMTDIILICVNNGVIDLCFASDRLSLPLQNQDFYNRSMKIT